MDCKSAEEIILTDYIDGKAAPQILREVEAHIASCGHCSEIAARLKSVNAAFREAKHIEPPARVWESIRSEINKNTEQVVLSPGFFESVRIFFARLKPAIVVTATAAILLIVLTVGRFTPQKGVTIIQDDIISLVTLYENGAGAEYDFGTPAENYFL